jgi:hypothetical protein
MTLRGFGGQNGVQKLLMKEWSFYTEEQRIQIEEWESYDRSSVRRNSDDEGSSGSIEGLFVTFECLS